VQFGRSWRLEGTYFLHLQDRRATNWATSKQIVLFLRYDVVPSGRSYGRFEDTYCLHLQSRNVSKGSKEQAVFTIFWDMTPNYTKLHGVTVHKIIYLHSRVCENLRTKKEETEMITCRTKGSRTRKKTEKYVFPNFYCLGPIILSLGLKGTYRKEHKAVRPIDLDRTCQRLRRLTTRRPTHDATKVPDGVEWCKWSTCRPQATMAHQYYFIWPLLRGPSTPHDPESDAGGSLSSWQGQPSR
jgi:hypothetical protein